MYRDERNLEGAKMQLATHRVEQLEWVRWVLGQLRGEIEDVSEEVEPGSWLLCSTAGPKQPHVPPAKPSPIAAIAQVAALACHPPHSAAKPWSTCKARSLA
jgi:hypothetical protein